MDVLERETPIDIDSAAKYLKVHRQTIFRYIRNGNIPEKFIHRLGRNVYFFQSELEKLLKKAS